MDEEMKKLLGDKWDEFSQSVTKVETDLTKEIEQLTQKLKDQGQELEEAILKVTSSSDEGDFDSEFLKFLTENTVTLQAVAKARHGEIEFNYDFLANKAHDEAVEKAVGDMSTSSGGDAAAAPVNHNTMLNRIQYRNDNPLIGLCTVIPTNSASLAYTETAPKEGGYSFVAEAAEKPQIDFQWTVRYAEPFKVAAYEVFSEEVVKDIPRIMATARGFLKDRHDLFKADAIYFSAGTPGLPTGATVAARAFVAGSMADALTDTNIMDVINAIITDIYITHNYADETPYRPNLVLMNPVDFFVHTLSVC